MCIKPIHEPEVFGFISHKIQARAKRGCVFYGLSSQEPRVRELALYTQAYFLLHHSQEKLFFSSREILFIFNAEEFCFDNTQQQLKSNTGSIGRVRQKEQ